MNFDELGVSNCELRISRVQWNCWALLEPHSCLSSLTMWNSLKFYMRTMALCVRVTMCHLSPVRYRNQLPDARLAWSPHNVWPFESPSLPRGHCKWRSPDKVVSWVTAAPHNSWSAADLRRICKCTSSRLGISAFAARVTSKQSNWLADTHCMTWIYESFVCCITQCTWLDHTGPILRDFCHQHR